MILPADKGHASVVLNTDTYHDKMKTLIESGPYQLINSLIKTQRTDLSENVLKSFLA